MMLRVSAMTLALAIGAAVHAQPVYPSNPDWQSTHSYYSYGTGAAFADINGDGWLDLVVADGNDMALGPLNVYYNDGNGAFPTSPGWQSTDYQYNGHLDVADVNGDGWIDVGVAHLGEFTTIGPIAKVYLNNNGTLSSTPDWEAGILGNAFGAAFGDVNGDGRPDLAVATGWSYGTPHQDKNCMFVNIDGTLETMPSWESDDTHDTQGALWTDADNDGWLDLALIAARAETRIYRNLGGVLETTASWTTSDSNEQDGIMLAVGDVNGDGHRELFATDNTQLGATGLFKQYTGLPGGFYETSYSWSYNEGYGSAIAVADVNGDDLLDVATGAWWDHSRLFLNTGSGLPTSPSWSSSVTSVIEKIVFGDVNPACGVELVFTEHFAPDGDRRLFHLPRQQVQALVEIVRDGVTLDPDEYAFSREYGWISLDAAPAVGLDVTYTDSRSKDMAISNWDSSKGNYLYYNQLIDDCNTNGVPDGCDIFNGTSPDTNGNGVPDECESLCPADVNGDQTVNVLDLLLVLAAWGNTSGLEDINGDGIVNVLDLLEILAAWGPCP